MSRWRGVSPEVMYRRVPTLQYSKMTEEERLAWNVWVSAGGQRMNALVRGNYDERFGFNDFGPMAWGEDWKFSTKLPDGSRNIWAEGMPRPFNMTLGGDQWRSIQGEQAVMDLKKQYLANLQQQYDTLVNSIDRVGRTTGFDQQFGRSVQGQYNHGYPGLTLPPDPGVIAMATQGQGFFGPIIKVNVPGGSKYIIGNRTEFEAIFPPNSQLTIQEVRMDNWLREGNRNRPTTRNPGFNPQTGKVGRFPKVADIAWP
jgi:hypothetical protein